MSDSVKNKRLLAALSCVFLGTLFGGIQMSAIAQSSEQPLYLWNIARFYTGLPQQDDALRVLQRQIDQNNPELLAADSIASNVWRDSPTLIGHEDILNQIPVAERTGSDPLEMVLAITSPRLGAPLDIEVLPIGGIESPSRVMVTLDQGGFLDDSVAGSRHRFDIQRQDSQWTIQRAGRQFRCQQGRGQQTFSAELCI